MPAYSFKERFVPMVKDGSKPGTIRAFRKYPVKVGQLAHLFYGMRTKFCIKLIDPSPVIREVVCILITAHKEVLIIHTNWLDEDERRMALKRIILETYKIEWLQNHEKDEFAWRDGFRHSDDPDNKEGCFELMCRFWRQTHELPFIGNHIIWGE